MVSLLHLHLVAQTFSSLYVAVAGTSITVNFLLLSSSSARGSGGSIDIYIDGQMVTQGSNYSPYQSDDPFTASYKVAPLTVGYLAATTHSIRLSSVETGSLITLLNEYSYVYPACPPFTLTNRFVLLQRGNCFVRIRFYKNSDNFFIAFPYSLENHNWSSRWRRRPVPRRYLLSGWLTPPTKT